MEKGPPSFDPFAHTRFVTHDPRLLDEHRRKRQALESAADTRDRLAAQHTPELPPRIA